MNYIYIKNIIILYNFFFFLIMLSFEFSNILCIKNYLIHLLQVFDFIILLFLIITIIIYYFLLLFNV